MAKLPWFKFFPTWWLGDTELSKCTSATRGVWMDLLCAMHQSGRSGELRGTTDQIARLARCSTAELTQALTELQTTGTADVTFRNNDVTVINRLMKRESKTRTDTALRVKKHRSNYDVTEKKRDRSKKIEVRSKNKANTAHAQGLEESNLFRKPTAPTLQQVQEVFFRAGGTIEQAERFFAKHEATGWYLNNSPIKNFASLVPGYLSAWQEKLKEITTPEKPKIWL
jgi:hypothetical protein